MGFSDPVLSPLSGYAYIDGLLWGSHWNDPASATVTRLSVYIAGTTSVREAFDFGGTTVLSLTSPLEVAAFNRALALMANVCNVVFSTGTKADADILMGGVSDATAEGNLGVAIPPGGDTGPLADQQGAVIINRQAFHSTDWKSLLQGGYDFAIYLHEIGHVLGLKHPHDHAGGSNPLFPGMQENSPYSFGSADLNQGVYTTMSYNDGLATTPNGPLDPTLNSKFGWQGTPMAFDIAALQHLYGANNTFKTGNDTYTLPSVNALGSFYSCIWDAGGIDTIVNASATGSTINLQEATLRTALGGGGFISTITGINGGFTIAKGAVIENATGGAGNDILTGNAANNELLGQGGNDKISGGDGDDGLLSGGDGDDVIDSGLGNNTIAGGEGADQILGRNGNDTIDGGNGMDVINAGHGVNTVNGGEGDDTITSLNGKDTIAGNAGADSLRCGAGGDLADGGDGDDRIWGDTGNDHLNGGLGRDSIYGGQGNDIINGGADSDILLSGEVGNDVIDGGLGNDVIDGGSGNNSLSGQEGNDKLTGGFQDDMLSGEAGADTIFGNFGLDLIDGGAGNDQLTGGDQEDVFNFDPGSNSDIIFDFTNDQDTLRIDPLFGFANAAAVVAATIQQGDYARIILGGGHQIYLTGFLAAFSGNTLGSLLDDIVIA